MKKILIVEDEQIIAADIKNLLEMEGYKVLTIQDTAENAIESIKSNKPDLVLIDIALSGKMNGIELAEKIGKSSPIPVIFVSAYTEKKTVDAALKTKPSGYVMKPISDENLMEEIRKALKEKSPEIKPNYYL